MQKDPAEEHLSVPLPGLLSVIWYVVFKMKAQGRAVPGCGSQFPPLAAVSSAAIPVRVKLKIPRANAAAATTVDVPSRWDPRANQSPTGALVAVLRTAALFDSRTGQIKNALAQCAKAATTLDIPSRWDPRTKQQPTGLIAYPAAQGRAVRFPYGSN